MVTKKHKSALRVIPIDMAFSSRLVFDFEGLYIELIMENNIFKIEQRIIPINNILHAGCDKKSDKGRSEKLRFRSEKLLSL